MADEPDSILNRLLGWITTPAQASATAAGAFLLGGGDAAINILPDADFLGASGLGALGGLAVILGFQSIGSARARARERSQADEEKALQKSVDGLTQLLVEKGHFGHAYDLADDYDSYLRGGGVSETELRDWMNALRDFLRSEKPPRSIS